MTVLPAEVCGPAQIPDRIDCKSKPRSGLARPQQLVRLEVGVIIVRSRQDFRLGGDARGDGSSQLDKLGEQPVPIRDGAVDAIKKGRIVERFGHGCASFGVR
jgi:hypothetical protein